VEREVDDELAFHLEMRVQQLVARGMDPAAAHKEALRQFGDVRPVRDVCVALDEDREKMMKRANRIEEQGQDLRYAFRMLRRNPVFTAVVVLTLALGIGANTAIFTLIDAVVLRKIAVKNPDELVVIGDPSHVSSLSAGNPRTDLISYPLYKDIRDRNTLVSGLLASGRSSRLDVRLSSAEEPHHPSGRYVSANYFDVLGVRAQIGRTFDGSEDAAVGASPVVVISDRYWTQHFNRDPRAVGASLTINDAPFTIIGVAPREFTGEIVGRVNDVWMPVTMQGVVQPNQKLLDGRDVNFLILMGRLKQGVTLEQAQAGFTTLVHQILADNATKDFPAQTAREQKVLVSSGARGLSRVRAEFAVPLYTLMAGVALLLLIICANVANLLLARAVARAREMGIRLAIGASRARVVRQLLTECAVLAVLSAGAGLVVSWWGSQLLLKLTADGTAGIPLDLGMNATVLSFTAAVSILAVAIFGLVPALRASRVDLATTLRSQGKSVVGGGSKIGRVGGGRLLIAGQVAISLVLLIGAALLVRSLQSLQTVETGLDRDHLLIVSLNARDLGYRGDRLRSLILDLTGRFERTPGVAAVSYSENGIFSGTESASTFQVPGFTARSNEDTLANSDAIGPGYVQAIGARLLAGREFTPSDDYRAPNVMLVNETMAKFYWPGESALGKTLVFDTSTSTVVGVVADVRDHELTSAPPRRYYTPFLGFDVGEEPGELNFAIRTTGAVAPVITPIRNAIKAADAKLATHDVEALTDSMRSSISQQRLVARLAVGFGVVALLLAAVGLYGVLTYAVNRRTNEIGLRMALGASHRAVVWMVLGDALKLVAIGALVGAPLAVAATRLLRNQLHGVEPTDPVAVTIAIAVLGATAVVAALVPARRAAGLDPLVALRAD
jgi:putative ABC transport system permease protein